MTNQQKRLVLLSQPADYEIKSLEQKITYGD